MGSCGDSVCPLRTGSEAPAEPGATSPARAARDGSTSSGKSVPASLQGRTSPHMPAFVLVSLSPAPSPAGSCWNDPVCPTPGFQLRQVLWPHVLGCGTKWRGSRSGPCPPRISADAAACHPAPCQVPSARARPQPHAALHELRGAFPGTLLSPGPKRGDSLRLERSVLRGSGLVWVL